MTKARPGAHHRTDESRRHAVPVATSESEAACIAAMQAEGLSPETIRQRLYLLRGFGKDPADVTQDDIVNLLLSRDLSPSSKAKYVAVLRATFADLVRWGLVERSPVDRMKTPRTPRRSPRPVSEAALAALETLPRESREYAWTILGAYAGMRSGEVCSITGEWLRDGLHGPIVRIHGKGSLVADVPAHPKVIEVLTPHAGNPEPIWPMWPSNLNRAWQRAAVTVGVEDVVFHQLRHSFATRLTRAGVDLLVIAEVCRHASVATTQRYVKVADEAPRAAMGLL